MYNEPNHLNSSKGYGYTDCGEMVISDTRKHELEWLDRNRQKVNDIALSIAAQDTHADGLVDAVLRELALSSDVLPALIERVLHDGRKAIVGIGITALIVEAAQNHFREKAEEQALNDYYR